MYSALSASSQLSPDLRPNDPDYRVMIANPRHVVIFLPALPTQRSSSCTASDVVHDCPPDLWKDKRNVQETKEQLHTSQPQHSQDNVNGIVIHHTNVPERDHNKQNN